jgi:hypothetical protein
MITYFGGQIRLGDSLQDSTTPRAYMPRYSPSTNRRTLLFESPVTGAGTTSVIRLYVSTSNTNLGEGFEFTWNARWDQATSRWIQDAPGLSSYAWAMVTGRFWMFSKNAGSVPWDDSHVHWDSYDLFDRLNGITSPSSGMAVRDGTFRVNSAGVVSNPASTTGIILNAVYAKSMIKSWSVCQYLLSSHLILDGFNVASLSVFTTWDWYVYYATPQGTGYQSIMMSILDDAQSQVSTQEAVMKNWFQQSTGFSIFFTDFNGTWIPTTVRNIGMHIQVKATT